ncbi:MAG TPA: hypothetical protein VEV63_00600 [Streptosporangiaceae bacterium]|nr:hypothetical protein [Streptosporangiaceae bacterium]
MFRLLRARGLIFLGVIVTAGSLAALGSPLGAAASSTPRPARLQMWRQAIERLGLPGKGCFTASYPRIGWQRTMCAAAPKHPYPPRPGLHVQTVGNGVDYSAEVSGLLTSATGSFDSVSGGATETGQQNGTGPQVANTFSLQLNAKPFTTPVCAGSPNPGCLGWQQFIYSTTFNEVFMQYWLLRYNTTCPVGWNTFMFPMSTDIYCWRNSAGGSLSGGPLTVAGLTGTQLTGNAGAATDSVVMATGSGSASASGADNVLGISTGWKGVEFALVGDCCGTQANFSAGTTINVRTTTHSGTHSAPTCVLEGFTGETNNLNLAAHPAIGTQAHPAIISTQTSAPGFPSCAAAAGIGDTHLTTFRSLLYDFQAAGDYELATTGPRFVVEARQVSGAPTWPNAAVNQAIATHIGKNNVAICPGKPVVGAPPSGRLVVNKRTVNLLSGHMLSLHGGGTVSLDGNVYLIRGVNGDSVQAVINSGHPNWIDVSVGVGRWPETVRGLLANARNNPLALESRGGTILTAPFHFTRFYHVYGDSWRVPARQSLLGVCGGKLITSDPRNLMYPGNINPKLAAQARSVCLQLGVSDASLAVLDACTVDVAVLGTKQAALAYVGVPAKVIFGKIIKP